VQDEITVNQSGVKGFFGLWKVEVSRGAAEDSEFRIVNEAAGRLMADEGGLMSDELAVPADDVGVPTAEFKLKLAATRGSLFFVLCWPLAPT